MKYVIITILVNLIFDPYTYLFSQNKNLDLLTFKFPYNLKPQLRGKIERGFGNFLIKDTYQEEIKIRQHIALGGFPGSWRKGPTGNILSFYSFSTFAHVTSSCEDQFTCRIENFNSFYRGINNIEENLTDPGGISGGPVFTVIQDGVIHLKFSGIISEGKFFDGTEILVLCIRPARFIKNDGAISY